MGEPDDDLLVVVSLPVTDQWGTIQELRSRHDLEDVLDALLRQGQLGECTGGGQGLGQQDIDLAVTRARWQAAWELLRSKLAELGLLGRATVRAYLDDEGEPRQLWPPTQDPPPP
jgi:hypothetical protein